MLPSDPAVQVALVGIFSTLITTIGVIFVAVLNNNKEREGAADQGVEATLRERIALRDEQLAELREDISELRTQLAEAMHLNSELRSEVTRLRERLAQS
jgi:predicted RNase H-like nuclease (RuvC/YqgF family)